MPLNSNPRLLDVPYALAVDHGHQTSAPLPRQANRAARAAKLDRCGRGGNTIAERVTFLDYVLKTRALLTPSITRERATVLFAQLDREFPRYQHLQRRLRRQLNR